MNEITVAQAIETAIAAERANERLFQGLEAKFSHYANLAAFWKQYAHEETKHAEWLEDLRARLTPEQLSGSVEASTLALLRAVEDISVDDILDHVKNLDDAYLVVNEHESGETNALFQFLLNNFEPNMEMRDFLRLQLGKHVAKISTDFPDPYKSIIARQAIKALK